MVLWREKDGIGSLVIHGAQYANRHNEPQDYFSGIAHRVDTVLIPVPPRQGCQQQQPQRYHSQKPRQREVSGLNVRAVVTSD